MLFFACVFLMISTSFHSFALFEGDIASAAEEELYRQCKDTYTAGKFGDAIQHIEKFLSSYPEGDHAGEILFMQAFLQPDIDVSMKMHRAIIGKYPNSEWAAKSHFQLGQSYYLRGEYDKALDHYGRIILSFSDDEVYWPARYWRCKSFTAKGDYEEAITALRSLEDSGSGKIGRDMILMSLGNCYLDMGDYERAAASYRSLIESMPDSHRVVSAYLLLAKSLQNLGKLGEAEESYQKVIKDYPRSIEAHQAREYLNSLSLTQPSHVEVQPAMPEAAQTASYFSVQVGAFSQWRNAKNLTNRLRKKGYPVSIILPSPGRSSLYKVRIGNFGTRDAASEAAKRLGEKEKLPTKVVRQSNIPS